MRLLGDAREIRGSPQFPAPAVKPGPTRILRTPYAWLALLLLPSVWQPRIHAGDLSSHIYNAWLATLIEKGQGPGLYIRTMYTNVLFDVYLEHLFQWFGAAWAQRVAAGSVVMVFAGGMLAYLRVLGRQQVWFLLPGIAMLAYGWVFHMGFFNFLLSAGFALLALSCFLRPAGPRVVGGCVLLALSFGSHFMPAFWAIGVLAYRWAYGLMKPRQTPVLFGVSVLTLGAIRLILNTLYETHPPVTWGRSLVGLDQFWVFGNWTFAFVPLMLIVWAALLIRLSDERSPFRMLLGFPAQVMLLNVAGILILPGEIRPPGYELGFTFITQRISFFVAISVFGLLAASRPRRIEIALLAVTCCAFFASIYVKGRELDRLEDRVDRIVATLPRDSRVIAPLAGIARTGQWAHIIDRACIGHCYSSANYEAGTNHFRIRINGPTPAAAPDFDTSFEMQAGLYHPPPGSPGYYQIDQDCGRGDELCVRYVAPAGATQP